MMTLQSSGVSSSRASITKIHEEVVQGSPEEVLQYFTDHPDHVRGEFVVLVDLTK
jgi:16S rRNA C1402 (ribose-2'-O) methylase RsmI